MSKANSQIVKSTVASITSAYFVLGRDNGSYLEPQTAAIGSLAIWHMMNTFDMQDVVPLEALLPLAQTAIERANKANNDMKEYHFTKEPINLIGAAIRLGYLEHDKEAKTVKQTMKWSDLVTLKESTTPFTVPVLPEMRRKHIIKGGKVKPSKLMTEAIEFLEGTDYHVDQRMVHIVQGYMDNLGPRKVCEAIDTEMHVWTNSRALVAEEKLFSDQFGDNRGRLYHVSCAGPNPQSSDFARSLYSHNVEQYVKKDSPEYFMFMNELNDIADGDWVTVKYLTRAAQNPVAALNHMLHGNCNAPSKPFTYIRLALDWYEFETTGQCDSRIGFGLDAKCSGTQYLAMIAGNIEMMKATGFVAKGEGKYTDPYLLSLKCLKGLLPKTRIEIANPDLVNRAAIKTPYMAIQYGGGQAALMGSSDFVKLMNGMGIKEEQHLDFAKVCIDAIKQALGKKINMFIEQVAKTVEARLEETGKVFLTYRHTDGQLVRKPCFPKEAICEPFSIRVDAQTRCIFGIMKDENNETKPWTIKAAQPTAEEFVRTFVVNFIQGIDALVARTVAKYAKQDGLRGYTSIHDCFRCCLADATKMMNCIRKAYKEIFVDNNQFENLEKQIGKINMFHTNVVTEEMIFSEDAYYFCQ